MPWLIFCSISLFAEIHGKWARSVRGWPNSGLPVVVDIISVIGVSKLPAHSLRLGSQNQVLANGKADSTANCPARLFASRQPDVLRFPRPLPAHGPKFACKFPH